MRSILSRVIHTILASIKSNIEIVVLAIVAVTSWPLVRTYPSVELMRYIYPVLFALHMLAAAIKIWRYYFVTRTPMMKPITLFILTNGFATLILALATGPMPWISIDTWRWLIVYGRFLTAGALLSVCIVGATVVLREIFYEIKHLD